MADSDSTATAAPAAVSVSSDARAGWTDEQKRAFWKKHSYFEALPDTIGPMRQLLREYSHVPAADIDAHIYAVRDKLWAVHKYPCIGRFAFLNLDMTASPHYQAAVRRLRGSPNERLLDLGCCVGQVLRQLVHGDRVPARQLSGSDLHRDFIDLGFELFRDGPPEANELTFVAGDLLAEDDKSCDALEKSVTMIHAANLFHLFSWDEQVKLGRRMVGFFKEDALDGAGDNERLAFFGAHLASRVAGEHRFMPGSPKMRYLHDATSFQKLWDEIGAATGTRWRIAHDPIKEGIGAAMVGNENVQYVQYAVWREVLRVVRKDAKKM
ncbi:hypothetical protein SCUCBS95973_002066 [Sporothrix curviconia]|uniref:Methyltransferase domain-containing protein n=1 Tax=Sporothrix curviconia TaxID=1260050 RepID=A0ABP0B3X1_9PEZI